MARAIRCSESPSSAAASRRASSSPIPSTVAISLTPVDPWVRVPVLSTAITCSSRAVSIASRSRISTPWAAASWVVFATTSGIASPSACGQAITRTVTTRAIVTWSTPPWMIVHTANVTPAEASAAQNSNAAARSASNWVEDLLASAPETRRMIPASAVSSPIAETATRRLPLPSLTVPAMTRVPGCLRTGADSPVIMASLISESPA